MRGVLSTFLAWIMTESETLIQDLYMNGSWIHDECTLRVPFPYLVHLMHDVSHEL